MPSSLLSSDRRFFFFVPCLLFLSACDKPLQQAAPPPPTVTVARPIVRTTVEWDEYTGRLDAVDMVEVRARVSGFILEAPFQEGSIVEKDAVLFQIDPRPFEARLAAAKGDEVQAQAKLQLAKDDLARGEKARAAGVLSPEEYDTRRQAVAQAEGVLASAQANVQAAQLDVEWCQVRAPIRGRISRKLVTPGNLISGGGGTTGGGGQATLLTTIASIDPIYCYIDPDENSVLKYQQLARQRRRASAHDARIECFMGLGNETGFPHTGFIDFVDNRVNASTATLRVRGVFPNPEGDLLPGFFARLRVAGNEIPNATLVTDTAIGTDQNLKYVLMVDAGNTVRFQPVKTGALVGGLRVIQEGLPTDARVVINGLMRARPGSQVNPQETPMPDDNSQINGQGGAPAASQPAQTSRMPASGPTPAAPASETR